MKKGMMHYKKNQNVHVEPMHDLRPHNTMGIDCVCNPKLTKKKSGWLVVHNSWDRREYQERPKRSN